MYVVVLPNGNLLRVGNKTRWFIIEATLLAAENDGKMRPVQVGDPRA